MLNKLKINLLVLSLVGVMSLSSCYSAPSHSVGFERSFNYNGDYPHYSMAYIYEDKEYTFNDEVTLDLYYGHDESRTKSSLRDSDRYILLYLDFGYNYYEYDDLSIDEFENEGYKNLEVYNLFFIKEIDYNEFYSEEYEYHLKTSFGFSGICEFNHHEDLVIPKEIVDYLILFETSFSVTLIEAYMVSGNKSEDHYYMNILFKRNIESRVFEGHLYFN